MNLEKFKKYFNEISLNLINKQVSNVFNSIGSHIFIEFGKDLISRDSREKKYTRKEWVIWIGNASWRISKNGKYVVGSQDTMIETEIQKLLSKRFLSIKVISQFFDLRFEFENGYQLDTFFNWSEESLWTIFFPDQNEIYTDFSEQKNIASSISISHHFNIVESFSPINIPLKKMVVSRIAFDNDNQPIFHFDNGFSLCLERCAWRLEKRGNYVLGSIDELDKIENVGYILSQLVSRGLVRIEISPSKMDSRIIFDDYLTIKTFTCSLYDSWKLYSGSDIACFVKAIK